MWSSRLPRRTENATAMGGCVFSRRRSSLCADDGGERLLEGLVTNLFVVAENPTDPNVPLVITAPVDRCLPG